MILIISPLQTWPNVLLLMNADYQPIVERIWTFSCWWMLIISLLQNASERFSDEIMIISLLHKRVRTSVADEMLILSLLHKRVRTSVADEMLIHSLLHKRVRTSVADEMLILSLLHKRVRTSAADEMLIISLVHKRVRTSVADEMLILSLLHKRVRTSVADEMLIISLVHKRVRTSVVDDTVCRHSIMSTIEHAYWMLKYIYILFSTVLDTTLYNNIPWLCPSTKEGYSCKVRLHTRNQIHIPLSLALAHTWHLVAPFLQFIPPIPGDKHQRTGGRSERTQVQAKVAAWNSFSYKCTRVLYSFRSFAHCRAASTVIRLLPKATLTHLSSLTSVSLVPVLR